MAIRGQPAILGCEFTSDSDLSALVVTWQRVEDSRVVHSFYYQKDQLERQDAHYKNRTVLFNSELKIGNASLRIYPVGPKDVGSYLCTVSNTKGTDKAQVQLEYGAFYTEPRLSISVNSLTVIVHFETEGYPKPEVTWLGEHGQILNNQTEITERPEGLFYVNSSCVVEQPALNLSFTLKNQMLNQELHRSLNIQSGEDKLKRESITIIILSVLCSILTAILFFVLLIMLKKRLPRVQAKSTASNGGGCSIPLQS
ncbi:CD276 antigen-like isoform X2 [Trichomycterus rosablanca]